MSVMEAETKAAFDAAVRAGEEAHLLTVGSEHRMALRITRGRLDKRGRWRSWQPDVFLIYRGCRVDRLEFRMLRERFPETVLMWVAWRLPRRLAYWAMLRIGAHATTGPYGDTVVPELSMLDALQRWDAAGHAG